MFIIIHIFETWQWAIVPTSVFIFINYISYRYKLNKFMDRDNDDTLGVCVTFVASLSPFSSSQQAQYISPFRCHLYSQYFGQSTTLCVFYLLAIGAC
jgi:hypothetical protein